MKKIKSLYKITHLAGMCRTGNDKVGHITHAVSEEVAICGKRPKGKSSGWSVWEDHELTCPKCVSRIKKLACQSAS